MGNKRNKNILDFGSKARAGTILSSLFRAIGSEVTELVLMKVPGESGRLEPRLVSKAEAIVRDCFEKAIPRKSYTESRIDDNGEMTEVEVAADPKTQLEYRKLIFDRMGGKAGSKDKGPQENSIADKISELSKNKLNKFADRSRSSTSADKSAGKNKKKMPEKKASIPKISLREHRK